jgi:hypothetical protein
MGRHDEHRGIPAQETRGGNRVNWAQAEPGETLPELPPDAYPEPDSEQLELPLDYHREQDDPEMKTK